jgi:hypothetical protein
MVVVRVVQELMGQQKDYCTREGRRPVMLITEVDERKAKI